MEIVLVLEQRRHLVLVPRRNELRGWECLFEVLDDVVALNVHHAVVNKYGHQSPRIDTQKPRSEILVCE